MVEGATVNLAPASFTDAGVLDTHTATINWGDGSATETGIVTEAGGSGEVAGSHVYATAGNYAVTVSVTDNSGASGSDTLTVTVQQASLAPQADAGGPYSVNEGDSVTLDGTGSSDPNGDLLTYAWDFDADGVFDDATGPNPVFSGADDGVVTVALRVTDPDGLSGTDSAVVTIRNPGHSHLQLELR